MPISPEFIARTVQQLEAARPVRHRKMFGGLGLYLGEAFFGVCDDEQTFFKVDQHTAHAYERKGMGPWIMGGQVNVKYLQVPDEVMADPEALGQWIDDAAGVALRTSEAKSRKGRA